MESKSAVTKAPLTLSIGDVDLTLAGFVDATAFFRSTNLGSGIGTSFGALPFSNAAAGRLTETRFSAQNSRFSLLATSQVGNSNVKGYLESDFLGIQPGNAFVTSNRADAECSPCPPLGQKADRKKREDQSSKNPVKDDQDAQREADEPAG